MNWREWLASKLTSQPTTLDLRGSTVIHFNQKESAATSAILEGLGPNSFDGTVPKPGYALAPLTRDGYERNATVFSIIQLYYKALGGLPWVLMQSRGRGQRPKKIMSTELAMKGLGSGHHLQRRAVEMAQVEDHRLLNLIARPNPYEDQTQFMGSMAAFYLLGGNDYVEMVWPDTGPNKGVPLEIYNLRPDRTGIIAGTPPGPKVAGYQYEHAWRKVRFEAETVAHMKSFHPLDDFYGLSPLQVAALTVLSDNEAIKWNRNLIKKGARPSGAFSTEQALPSDVHDRNKAELKETMGGAENAGEILLLSGGLEWKTFMMTPLELDFLEGLKNNTVRICRIYTTPPEMVGDPDHRTYNSMPEARAAFYQEGALPVGYAMRDLFNAHIVPRFGDGLRLDIDLDMIEAIQEDRVKSWERVGKAGWLSINEQRRATGYDDYGSTEGTDGSTADPALVEKANVPLALLKPAAPAVPAELSTDDPPQPPPTPEQEAAKALRLETRNQALTRSQKRTRAKLKAGMAAHFRGQHEKVKAALTSAINDLTE